MFNHNEIQSAASAIAGAYRLVNCASSAQTSFDDQNSSIVECEAILLRFRCYYQDDQFNFTGSPQTFDAFSEITSGLDLSPAQATKLLPLNKMQTKSQSQEDEESLISQIEAALMSTIADLDGQSAPNRQQTESIGVEHSPSEACKAKFSLKTGSFSKTTPALSARKLRCLQSPSPPKDHEMDTRLMTRLKSLYVHFWLNAIEKFPLQDEIRLVPLLDCLARLSYEAGLVEESLKLHERSLFIKHECWGRKHVGRAVNLESIARIRYQLGDFETAESDYLEAIMLRELHLNKQANSQSTLACPSKKADQQALSKAVETIHNLARIYAETGRIVESEHQYKRSLDLTRPLRSSGGKSLVNDMDILSCHDNTLSFDIYSAAKRSAFRA